MSGHVLTYRPWHVRLVWVTVMLGVGLVLGGCGAPAAAPPPAPILSVAPAQPDVPGAPDLVEAPRPETTPTRRPLFGFLRRSAPGISAPEAPGAALPSESAALVEDDSPIAPSMSDAEIEAAGLGAAETPVPSQRSRFLGGLFKRDSDALSAPVVEPPLQEVPQVSTEAPLAPSLTDAEIAEAGVLRAPDPAPSRRPRLLGGLFRRTPGQVPAALPETPQAPVELAAAPPADDGAILDAAPEMAPPPQAEPRPEPPRQRGWPFGRGNRPATPSGPDLARPEFPTSPGSLRFGQVAEACGIKKRVLGTEVARAGGYRIYDTDPSSVTPRAQYVTGFKDGCPRQFTGSLALFGSAQVHEVTRYDRANQTPYSETDLAFERVKNRICGVRRGQPCPRGKAEKLDRETAFVTVYRGFGDTGLWLEMFLHKGQLVSYQTRSR